MNTNTKQVEKPVNAALVRVVEQQAVIDAFKGYSEKHGRFAMTNGEKDGVIFCTYFPKTGPFESAAGILIQPNRCYDLDDCKELGLDTEIPGHRWTPFIDRAMTMSVKIGELLVPRVGEEVAKLLGNPAVSRTGTDARQLLERNGTPSGMHSRITSLIWYTDQGSELTIQLHDSIRVPGKYKPGKF